MALPELQPHYPRKPGRWLGFFFWLSVIAAIFVVVVEYPFVETPGDDSRWFQLDGGKWLAFLGGWTALLGALTSARISLQNTIKQHTINTLLQMRLSSTYMDRVERLNARYGAGEGIYYVTLEESEKRPAEACIPDVVYILNYLEFIASAIRHGDLDESLMRESLRGVVCNNFELAELFVQQRRKLGGGKKNPKLYQHLEWLYRRWYVEEFKRPLVTRVY